MKSSSSNSAPLLFSVLIVALLAALFYYVVLPKMDEVNAAEANISTIQSSISSLESQIATITEEQSAKGANEFAIRKQLPAKRAIDGLLLNIEEMEYVTGSRIVAVSFNSYDELVNSSNYADPNAPTQTEQTSDGQPVPASTETSEGSVATPTTTTETSEGSAATPTTTTENTTADASAAPVSTIAATTLPTNLKMITFSLEIEAPNAKQLVGFIKEIESLERVMHIDTIDFSLNGEEIEYAEDASEVVSTTVQVTTFYYE